MKLKQRYDFVAISDLASFEFCPVSYAIQETFDITTSPIIEEGFENHKPVMIDKLIEAIKSRTQKSTEKSREPIKNKFFKEILNSEIILKSYSNNSKPIFNENKSICGMPDYLFRKNNGDNFIVDERHTYRKIIKAPWYSHIIQLAGYVFGLKSLNVNYGYIVYFHWSEKTKSPIIDNPTIYLIEPSSVEKAKLRSNYIDVIKLKDGKALVFPKEELNFHKCIKCSVRYYCKHKTGTNPKLILPYQKN